MLLGCYYRCPIVIEEEDEEYPRFFVLGQLEHYNELSGSASMALHDLQGSKAYYGELFKHTVFPAGTITRCAAIPGGLVRCAHGPGTVVARLLGEEGGQPYLYDIRLRDGRYMRLSETQLQIEYTQMDYSPISQLKAYEFQHPSWFLNRLKVSRNHHLMNMAIHGFKVISGCRALLLPHQISTVARCFESQPIRFMLADEVGLGKTVEACSILKILRGDHADFRALLVVPGALISQWRSELQYKFDIPSQLSSAKASVCLLPLEDLDTASNILASDWNLLLVDETHRLLSRDCLYRQVLILSKQVEHLLLLSATPIQDRREEYRRLLILLNPERYEHMEPGKFDVLVNKQKRIQRSVNQQLGRLDRYEEYREVMLEALGGIAQSLEDPALRGLMNAVDMACADGGKDMVSQILAYLCTNYRLERNVIRNRRQLLSERMASRTLRELPYPPLSADDMYNETGVIQNTLSYLSNNSDNTPEYAANTAIPLLSALFSSPWGFVDALERLGLSDEALIEDARTWKKQAELEHGQADRALDEDPELIHGRLLRALDYLDQETGVMSDPACKVVVFTAHNATLREFYRLITSRCEPRGIRAVSFGSHMDREALEDSVYKFQNDPDCRIIICDETGGEGRNFQNAALLLHLDLPWNANVLEQRIGRLDRLGRDPGREVLSVVLCAAGTVEEQLFMLWRDGMKLFEQSLSGLEIVTGELGELISSALLDDFYNGLSNAFADILDRAQEMRESVEDEQLFDLGTTLHQPLSRGIDHLLRLYAAEEENLFARAMLGWGSQAGLEAEIHAQNGVVEFREDRFSTRSAIQSLFVPPDWGAYASTSIMRRESKILGSFDRKTAALREDLLFFAPGDAVYDAIATNAIGCSRGRCCALQLRGAFRYEGLIFIYNAEPDISALLKAGATPESLSQFALFLPLEQIYVAVPLSRESREIPEQEVLQALRDVDPHRADHLGRRGGGRVTGSPLERFIERTPPADWKPLVIKAEKSARRTAEERMHEGCDLELAKKEMQRILYGHKAEHLYFERESPMVEEKQKIFQAVLRALKRARPVLDSACFLRVAPQ